MPALSKDSPDTAHVTFKNHTALGQNYTEPMTTDSKYLLTASQFILSISATKQEGAADPSSCVECFQAQLSRFREYSLYKGDVLVFLLAIDRSNTSDSQLNSRADGDDT